MKRDGNTKINYYIHNQEGKLIFSNENAVTTANPRFSGGVAIVGKADKRYGLIDTTGKYIVEMKYDSIDYVSENLYITKKIGVEKYAFMDKKGHFISDFEYDRAFCYNNENVKFFPVQKNDKWGYADTSGKIVLPFEYADAYEFKDGFAVVMKDLIKGYPYGIQLLDGNKQPLADSETKYIISNSGDNTYGSYTKITANNGFNIADVVYVIGTQSVKVTMNVS